MGLALGKTLKIFLLVFMFTVTTCFVDIANADMKLLDRYALPNTKINIMTCRNEALRLYPGIITEMHSKNSNIGFLFEIRISADDGFDSLVFCDAKTGKIISAKDCGCRGL